MLYKQAIKFLLFFHHLQLFQNYLNNNYPNISDLIIWSSTVVTGFVIFYVKMKDCEDMLMAFHWAWFIATSCHFSTECFKSKALFLQYLKEKCSLCYHFKASMATHKKKTFSERLSHCKLKVIFKLRSPISDFLRFEECINP